MDRENKGQNLAEQLFPALRLRTELKSITDLMQSLGYEPQTQESADIDLGKDLKKTTATLNGNRRATKLVEINPEQPLARVNSVQVTVSDSEYDLDYWDFKWIKSGKRNSFEFIHYQAYQDEVAKSLGKTYMVDTGLNPLFAKVFQENHAPDYRTMESKPDRWTPLYEGLSLIKQALQNSVNSLASSADFSL